MERHESDLVLELEHVLPASPDLVFRMLTEPDQLERWWGPRGFTTPEAQVDLAVNGRYRFTMQPPEGDVFHLAGDYLEIDPPDRLVLTFRWEEPDPDDRETVVRLSLEKVEGATRVRLWQGTFATEERLALHRDGWSESFEKLSEVLASPT